MVTVLGKHFENYIEVRDLTFQGGEYSDRGLLVWDSV